MPEQPDWHLDGFPARITEWAGRANPRPDLLRRVIDWCPTIAVDPYHQAFSEPGEGGKRFYREVPDAVADGRSVVVSYSIDADRQTVRCHRFELRDDPPGPEHLH